MIIGVQFDSLFHLKMSSQIDTNNFKTKSCIDANFVIESSKMMTHFFNFFHFLAVLDNFKAATCSLRVLPICYYSVNSKLDGPKCALNEELKGKGHTDKGLLR